MYIVLRSLYIDFAFVKVRQHRIYYCYYTNVYVIIGLLIT